MAHKNNLKVYGSLETGREPEEQITPRKKARMTSTDRGLSLRSFLPDLPALGCLKLCATILLFLLLLLLLL